MQQSSEHVAVGSRTLDCCLELEGVTVCCVKTYFHALHFYARLLWYLFVFLFCFPSIIWISCLLHIMLGVNPSFMDFLLSTLRIKYQAMETTLTAYMYMHTLISIIFHLFEGRKSLITVWMLSGDVVWPTQMSSILKESATTLSWFLTRLHRLSFAPTISV